MKLLIPLVYIFFSCKETVSKQELSFDSIDFSLEEISEKKFNFKESTITKPISVLFFGYSHCPDICSETLNIFSKAISKLNYSKLNQLQFIFISVDSSGDTKEQLLKFSKNFDSRIIFLRGSEEDIKKIKTDFKLTIMLDSVKNADKSPKIIHSTNIYLMNKINKKIKLLPHMISTSILVDEILAEMNHLQ
jgi:protein SCO1/2